MECKKLVAIMLLQNVMICSSVGSLLSFSTVVLFLLSCDVDTVNCTELVIKQLV